MAYCTCSSGGYEFGHQHPHQVAHNHLLYLQLLGIWLPILICMGPAHVADTQMHIKISQSHGWHFKSDTHSCPSSCRRLSTDSTGTPVNTNKKDKVL